MDALGHARDDLWRNILPRRARRRPRRVRAGAADNASHVGGDAAGRCAVAAAAGSARPAHDGAGVVGLPRSSRRQPAARRTGLGREGRESGHSNWTTARAVGRPSTGARSARPSREPSRRCVHDAYVGDHRAAEADTGQRVDASAARRGEWRTTGPRVRLPPGDSGAVPSRGWPRQHCGRTCERRRHGVVSGVQRACLAQPGSRGTDAHHHGAVGNRNAACRRGLGTSEHEGVLLRGVRRFIRTRCGGFSTPCPTSISSSSSARPRAVR